MLHIYTGRTRLLAPALVEAVKSAAAPGQFIRTSVPKAAFAGKSNVGKSSG